MEKWEYRKEYMSPANVSELNKLGEKGWELCGVDYRTYIFKRKIQQG